ncbi:MAG: hypothetical protein KC731_21355 [Myxococcales bacterium]|nr:hypothetical protein [Myxococcales bacterium]
MKKLTLIALTTLTLPSLMGARGDGCNRTAFSRSPAPDMTGTWDVQYDDQLDVEVTIGGVTHTASTGTQGGLVTIDHDGQPFTFDLRCEREEIVCPSEVWPKSVAFRQDDERYPHRVWMQVTKQECSGEMVAPDMQSCGEGTPNPNCEDVCDGEVQTVTREAFGTIDEEGTRFTLGLGLGAASNGVNCAMLGGSYVDGDLETTGDADSDWQAVSSTGEVVAVYAGGCMWVADANDDGQKEALAVGAQLRFATGFSAEKAN